jgi:arginine decarboxylase
MMGGNSLSIKKSDDPDKSRINIDHYHSPTQVRFDSWHKLVEYTKRLTSKSSGAKPGSILSLRDKIKSLMGILETIEEYTAFPSVDDIDILWGHFNDKNYAALSRCVERIVRALCNDSYRRRNINLAETTDLSSEGQDIQRTDQASLGSSYQKPYFEVLFVDKNARDEIKPLKKGLARISRDEDEFVYDILAVPSFEDALIAVLLNYNIQAVVIRYEFPLRSKNHLKVIQRYLQSISDIEYGDMPATGHGPLLGDVIAKLRPELDIYLVTDTSVQSISAGSGGAFSRVFYQQEDYLELHLNMLRGVGERYETPFFNALKKYSRKPTGVFHAMPISRGKSVTKSHWIQDMVKFYGINIFLAETSATSGGLDSLLQPHGPIKKAQQLAARAFGARHTFFVTNGTSTANKIVVQALVKPHDIVLIDRDCHKSHHYGMMLSGAFPSYLDSYPLHEYSMYGAVPLSEIKQRLLAYRDAGKLDQVKMLLLTNCTFDGVVYNVEKVMEECLAIKPDLVFLWDEAWFAFAAFTPTFRQRTAMATARKLARKYRSKEYRVLYEQQAKSASERPADESGLLPDPDKVRVRVYATQSTHKSLTSLRQGSMIHIYDQDFNQKVAEPFNEAFMTHTSTSPNYQILASLDLGRRQAELEGYEMVQKQIELAMSIREQVATNPKLTRYFRFLVARDLVPEEFRPSKIEAYIDVETGWANDNMEEAWALDDFVVDPTRLTLYIGETGIDGDTFKNQHLMDKYGIQVNKTSRNTVLFMTNIGTTRSSVSFLIDVLTKIANNLELEQEEHSRSEQKLFEKKVNSLTLDLPPLPDFSRFHDSFRPSKASLTPEGDIRKAFFMAYDDDNCEYVDLETPGLEEDIDNGLELVAASFLIPYPPGFPILVPGQVISTAIISFMKKLDVKEIHGYQPELGIHIFTNKALEQLAEKALDS